MGKLTPLYLLACLGLFAACADEAPCPTNTAGGDASLQEAGAKQDGLQPSTDQGAAATCAKACTSEGPYLCTKDSASGGKCVECLTDGHCAANKESLGKMCRNKLCVCDADTECAGKLAGARCQGSGPRWCGCTEGKDCSGGRVCAGRLFGATTCVPPCKVDADCKLKENPICDKATGKCEACLLDSHCAKASGKRCHPTLKTCVACKRDAHCTSSSKPYCWVKNGTCVACLASADCKANKNGSACSGGVCTCKADADCKGPNAWANTCIPATKRCACTANSDCTANANGPTCDGASKKCSCASDTECKKSPFSKCKLAYSSATYKLCFMVCKADTDCPDPLFPACSTSSGNCLRCTADKHCTTHTWATTCSKGRCAECAKDADCDAASLGSKCTSGMCTCAKSADCAGRSSGKVCHPNLLVCGCAKESDCVSGKKCTAKTAFGAKICK